MRREPTIWLHEQLAVWVKESLISEYQRQAIQARYPVRWQRQQLTRWVWMGVGLFFLGLAGLLGGMSIWSGLPVWGQYLVVGGGLLVTWGGIWGATQTGRWTRWVREGSVVMNGLVLLAGVMVMGGWGWPEAMVVALTLSWPLAWGQRSWAWPWVAMGLLHIGWMHQPVPWVQTLMLMHAIGLTWFPVMVIPKGRLRQVMAWAVSLSVFPALLSVSHLLHPDAFMVLPAMVYAAVVGGGWSMKRQHVMATAFTGVGMAVVMVTLFCGSFQVVWADWTAQGVWGYPIMLGCMTVVMGIHMGALLSMGVRPWVWVSLAPSVALFLGVLGHALMPGWVLPLVFLVGSLALSGGMMAVGITQFKRAWFSGGVAGLLMISVAHWLAIDWPLMARVMGFLMMGVVIVGVARWFNRWQA